jgi:hypothetical protein
MVLVAWAVLGVVLGAAGSEVLRARKPELIEKVEDAAKRLVDSVFPCGSTDQEDDSPQEADEEAVDEDEEEAGAAEEDENA